MAGAFTGPLAPVAVPVGALIGGGLGYFFGDKFARRLAELLQAERSADAARESGGEFKHTIEMRVDAKGRPRLVKAVSDSKNASIDVDMGMVMVGG